MYETYSTKIQNYHLEPLQLSPTPKAFHPSDTKRFFKTFPPRKHHGLTTSTVLKKLPEKVILFLTTIYNATLRTTYFPVLWEPSLIKMIPKPSKPSHIVSSYRTISLLLLFGKILE